MPYCFSKAFSCFSAPKSLIQVSSYQNLSTRCSFMPLSMLVMLCSEKPCSTFTRLWSLKIWAIKNLFPFAGLSLMLSLQSQIRISEGNDLCKTGNGMAPSSEEEVKTSKRSPTGSPPSSPVPPYRASFFLRELFFAYIVSLSLGSFA